MRGVGKFLRITMGIALVTSGIGLYVGGVIWTVIYVGETYGTAWYFGSIVTAVTFTVAMYAHIEDWLQQ